MQVYAYEKPGAVGIIAMFFISGASKLLSQASRQFDVNRMPAFLPRFIALLLVILAGIFEIVASGMVIHDIFYDEKTKDRLSSKSEYAILFLMGFTLVVTLMFYVYPLKYRALLSNVSTISGLAFVYQIIKRNQIQMEAKVSNKVIKRVEEMLEKKDKTDVPVPVQSESVHGPLQQGKSEC